MERALREELNTINSIKNKIYPTNAPKDIPSPYLVYTSSYFKQIKTFEGYQNSIEESYLIKIFSNSYDELKKISKDVKTKLLTLPGRSVQGIRFDDIEMNNIGTAWAEPIKLYSSILDIKFFYKEE